MILIGDNHPVSYRMMQKDFHLSHRGQRLFLVKTKVNKYVQFEIRQYESGQLISKERFGFTENSSSKVAQLVKITGFSMS
ncbi:hypothetical protein NSS70_01325 [Aeribacillus sp. FSL K6-2848]|uniref:hypothetical protein n=1 Tax=Aeribacillus sp. FSL K6-2848 TaxID=2954612 RepID=UPI0030F6406B